MITLKMADKGRSDFYVVFTMSVCALGVKQLLICLLFQIIRLRYHVCMLSEANLKLIYECELHSLPNKTASGAKDHGKNYIKIRPPLVRYLLRNRVLLVAKVVTLYLESCMHG